MASLRYRPQNMIFSCLVLTNRPRASRMTEVWKGKGKLVKKEEPMGTKLDRLVVTAIACVVISWESLSLTCISFGVLVWSCHFHPLSLDRVCPCHLWQPFVLTALKPKTWNTFSPDNVFLMFSLSLDTDAFSAAILWPFPRQPYLFNTLSPDDRLGSYFLYRRSCMSAFWRGHFGAAAGSCCQSGLCALERACWRRCGVPWKVLLRALVSERRVRFGAGMLVPLHGAAIRVEASVPLQASMPLLLQVASWRCSHSSVCALEGCCLKVLVSEWSVRFGAGMLVPVEGAAARRCWKVTLQLEGCCRGQRCCLTVLPFDWRVRFGAGLLLPAGAGGGCCFRVLIMLCALGVVAECRCRVLLQGAVRVVCGLLVLVQGAPARVLVQDAAAVCCCNAGCCIGC